MKLMKKLKKFKGRKGLILVVAIIVIVVGSVGYLWSSQARPAYPLASVITLTYSDGTSRTFSPSGAYPLSIVDTAAGKTVNSLSVKLYFTAQYSTGTGITLKSWNLYDSANQPLTTKLMILDNALGISWSNGIPSGAGIVYQKTETLPSGFITVAGAANPGGYTVRALPINTPTLVYEYQATIAQFEALYSGFTVGHSYSLFFTIPSTITASLTFSEGTVLSSSFSGANLQWQFGYANGPSLTSVGVAWLV